MSPTEQQSPYGPMSRRPTSESNNDIFLNSSAVRQRYGVSRMWIFRRSCDNSGFPLPIIVAGRKLWKLCDLERWERAQVANA